MNIDLEDVWRELDQALEVRQEMQPGDVTINMIAERYRISNEMARRKMNDLVRSGQFELIKIIGTDLNVYRLVK